MNENEIQTIVNAVLAQLAENGSDVTQVSDSVTLAQSDYDLLGLRQATGGLVLTKLGGSGLHTVKSDVDTAKTDIAALQSGQEELSNEVFDEELIQRANTDAITTSWIANQPNNLGGIVPNKGGWRVLLFDVSAGERLVLKLVGSASGNQAMAAAFYSSSELGTSTYLDCALYDEGGNRVVATNSYGDWDLVVPDGATVLAVSVFSTTQCTLEVWKNVSRIDTLDFVKPESLARVNLFSEANVRQFSVLDSSSGVVGNWLPDVRHEYAAVARIPITRGQYYAIINPYWRKPITRAGVSCNNGDNPRDYGNTTADNILFAGRRYAVVQAVCWRAQGALIDTLNFQLYRTAQTVPYPIETPMVEVYEMSTADEALSYIKSRFEEDCEFGDNVNIDRKILGSQFVGTLSSMFNGSSMLVMGDSITANHSWTDYIANRFKWHGIHNIAIGGANISGAYDKEDGSDPRNLLYQMLNAASFLGDVAYVEGAWDDGAGAYVKKIDCVFISMGYNDIKNGAPLGSLADVKGVAYETFEPSDTTSGFSSVAAAMKYCLFYMKNNLLTGTFTVNDEDVNVALDCRHARFIWQTPIATTSVFGSQTGEYTDARLRAIEDVIVEVSEYYSVGIINGRLRCGFTREEEELIEGGKYLSDKIHPTALGYIKLGEMNASGLISNFI